MRLDSSAFRGSSIGLVGVASCLGSRPMFRLNLPKTCTFRRDHIVLSRSQNRLKNLKGIIRLINLNFIFFGNIIEIVGVEHNSCELKGKRSSDNSKPSSSKTIKV